MSPLAEEITLGAEEEARRLWRGACDARARAADDLVALCEVLDLGLRAAEILLIHRLQPVREKFPATIALQLETPDPALDVMRDAIAEPKAIQFTELLDLLSAEDLECVGPRLHRGWEDRVFSCRRSRETASAAIGLRLEKSERQQLLLLSAYRNRIFRYPPPTRIRPADVLGALAALDSLFDRLLTKE